jgi:hypothetical protein
MTDDPQTSKTEVVAAEGFDLPAQAPPEPPP